MRMTALSSSPMSFRRRRLPSCGGVPGRGGVPEESARVSAKIAANDEIYDLEDTHSAAEPRVRRIKTPHAHHDAYRRASRHPAVVAFLAELWGRGRYDPG